MAMLLPPPVCSPLSPPRRLSHSRAYTRMHTQTHTCTQAHSACGNHFFALAGRVWRQSLQDPPGLHSLSDSVAPTLPEAPVTGRNTLRYSGLNEQRFLLTERAPRGPLLRCSERAPGVRARLPAHSVCARHTAADIQGKKEGKADARDN